MKSTCLQLINKMQYKYFTLSYHLKWNGRQSNHKIYNFFDANKLSSARIIWQQQYFLFLSLLLFIILSKRVFCKQKEHFIHLNCNYSIVNVTKVCLSVQNDWRSKLNIINTNKKLYLEAIIAYMKCIIFIVYFAYSPNMI